MADNTPQGPNQGGSKKTKDGEKPKRTPFGPFWILLVLSLFVVMLFMFDSPGYYGARVPYSKFRAELDKDNVASVEFVEDSIKGEWKEKPEFEGQTLPIKFNTKLPPLLVEDRELIADLRAKDVKTVSKPPQFGANTILNLMLIGMMIAFLWFMIRRNSDPMGSGMMGSFIKSPAKRFQASDQPTTFKDVAAMDNAKMELQEIVDFLKDATKFTKLGARIPKGVLLMGQPGTGKTLLARATAGEAGVPFFSINGSEFIQMFVGVGASRVRDLFRTAKDAAPCIIFIDEIDAVGRVRGAGVGGGHDEREQTLNQILGEMDGFTQGDTVIVLAATNRPDVLDPALLRPGRFDRHIAVEKPTKEGRVAILKVHSRKVPLDDEVDLEAVATGAVGFSGADLQNLVNEAALNASRKSQSRVKMEDFEIARDRVLMGPVREEVLNEHEKRMTAYHEAGHALIAWLLPELDRVHKVTVIPRGRALGVTQLLPEEETYNVGEKRLHSQLVMMLAGRAAEKLIFDEYSAGAEDDLKRATGISRRMVGHWGMSEKIGPVAFRQGSKDPFLGKDMHEHREFSEETARIIDLEVQRILVEAGVRATTMLDENRDKMIALAEALVDAESLDTKEITELLGERAGAPESNGKAVNEDDADTKEASVGDSNDEAS
jgi:cell division protease FtsH